MALTRLLRGSDWYITEKSPKVLETKWAGPCAIVTVYQRDKRAGVLGHFATPDGSYNFSRMMKWVAAKMKPNDLEVTLTGVSLETPEPDSTIKELIEKLNAYKLQKRAYLVSAFESMGVRPDMIRQRFSEPDTIAACLFYIATGEVKITQEPLNHVFQQQNLQL